MTPPDLVRLRPLLFPPVTKIIMRGADISPSQCAGLAESLEAVTKQTGQTITVDGIELPHGPFTWGNAVMSSSETDARDRTLAMRRK